MEKKASNESIKRIALIGVMAAIVYVVTIFRFPLLGSKVHFANAMCLLSGLLLGPLNGGLAAGLGSALYDLLTGGYSATEAVITFINKFSMAWVCAMLAGEVQKRNANRVVLASVVGALTYVLLYLTKSGLQSYFIEGLTLNAIWIKLTTTKLLPSLINAVAASDAAPILYAALYVPMRTLGLPYGRKPTSPRQ